MVASSATMTMGEMTSVEPSFDLGLSVFWCGGLK
jgi:hypothetical protein